MAGRVVIKVSHDSDVRRITFPKTPTYTQLRERVAEAFNLANQFAIKYFDEDQDLITVSSDDDVEEVVQVFSSRPWRFFIQGPGDTTQSIRQSMLEASTTSSMLISQYGGYPSNPHGPGAGTNPGRSLYTSSFAPNQGAPGFGSNFATPGNPPDGYGLNPNLAISSGFSLVPQAQINPPAQPKPGLYGFGNQQAPSYGVSNPGGALYTGAGGVPSSNPTQPPYSVPGSNYPAGVPESNPTAPPKTNVQQPPLEFPSFNIPSNPVQPNPTGSFGKAGNDFPSLTQVPPSGFQPAPGNQPSPVPGLQPGWGVPPAHFGQPPSSVPQPFSPINSNLGSGSGSQPGSPFPVATAPQPIAQPGTGSFNSPFPGLTSPPTGAPIHHFPGLGAPHQPPSHLGISSPVQPPSPVVSQPPSVPAQFGSNPSIPQPVNPLENKAPVAQPQPAVPESAPQPQPQLGGEPSDANDSYSSQFLGEEGSGDMSEVEPNSEFEKIWNLKNSGRSEWGRGTEICWIAGDKIEPFRQTLNPEVVKPGQTCTLKVALKAPPHPGRYVSYYRMALPTGSKFGNRVWADIIVKEKSPEEVVPAQPPVGQPGPGAVPAHPPELQNDIGELVAMGFPTETVVKALLKYRNQDNAKILALNALLAGEEFL